MKRALAYPRINNCPLVRMMAQIFVNLNGACLLGGIRLASCKNGGLIRNKIFYNGGGGGGVELKIGGVSDKMKMKPRFISLLSPPPSL
jgi:hypothetical protein